MTITRSFVFLTLFYLITKNCCAQRYVGHATLNNYLKKFSLFDSTSKTKYELDSTQIIITAIDSSGRQLWQTDPWKDNHLEEYRVKRPIIVHLDLIKNKRTNNKDVLWIVYNNTQFGTIDKLTGEFTWMGQD